MGVPCRQIQSILVRGIFRPMGCGVLTRELSQQYGGCIRYTDSNYGSIIQNFQKESGFTCLRNRMEYLNN